MKAMVIDRYGGPDELHWADVPDPQLSRGQALVRTQFIGVNPKDIVVRKGKFRTVTGNKFPIIVGHDIAGEVIATSKGCDLQQGELVYGMINDFRGRAYAELASVGCDQIARVPNSIDLKTAAAVPLAAQTALQALRDIAKVTEGQDVLVNGASGGVGTFAIQIAKILGGRVTAVCSDRNAELCQSLGAEQIVDYKNVDLPSIQERFDAVFDVFGNYTFERLRRLLKKRATYVHTVPSKAIISAQLKTLVGAQRARLVVVRSRREQLDWLSRHIDDGALRVVVDRSFTLEQAPAAHRYLETKRARGKVVLQV